MSSVFIEKNYEFIKLRYISAFLYISGISYLPSHEFSTPSFEEIPSLYPASSRAIIWYIPRKYAFQASPKLCFRARSYVLPHRAIIIDHTSSLCAGDIVSLYLFQYSSRFFLSLTNSSEKSLYSSGALSSRGYTCLNSRISRRFHSKRILSFASIVTVSLSPYERRLLHISSVISISSLSLSLNTQ